MAHKLYPLLHTNHWLSQILPFPRSFSWAIWSSCTISLLSWYSSRILYMPDPNLKQVTLCYMKIKQYSREDTLVSDVTLRRTTCTSIGHFYARGHL